MRITMNPHDLITTGGIVLLSNTIQSFTGLNHIVGAIAHHILRFFKYFCQIIYYVISFRLSCDLLETQPWLPDFLPGSEQIHLLPPAGWSQLLGGLLVLSAC